MIASFTGTQFKTVRFVSVRPNPTPVQVESLEDRTLYSGGVAKAVESSVASKGDVYEFSLHHNAPAKPPVAGPAAADPQTDSMAIRWVDSGDAGVLAGVYVAPALAASSHPMETAVSARGTHTLNVIDSQSFAGRPPSTKKGTMPKTVQRTVLLVEDDPTSRLALATLLRRRGWNVTVATTVAEGLRQLSDRPDNVIVDLNLPDGDGERVVRQIRDSHATSRVTVMTGVDDPARLSRLNQLHPESVLNKPVNVAALLRSMSMAN